MATSSIFHNVIIDDPKRADAFVAALDASMSDPYKGPEGIMAQLVTDKDEIVRLHELRRRNRGVIR